MKVLEICRNNDHFLSEFLEMVKIQVAEARCFLWKNLWRMCING